MRIILKIILLIFLLFVPLVLIVHLGWIEYDYLKIIGNQAIGSIQVISGVVAITTFVGVSVSWLFALYEFPFKRSLEIILILGMVFPSYVLAFFYSDTFSIHGYWALIFTLVISTLPYVFMITTMSLRSQSQQCIESALMLGKRNSWIKLKVIFPLMKPAIILSLLLVVGDTFSEFGATYFYGINTIMTGIYEIWFSLHEPIQGIRLASWTFVIILTLYYFINTWKHSLVDNQPNLSNSVSAQSIQPEKTGRMSGILITSFISILVIFTFFIPMGVLGIWVLDGYAATDWIRVLTVTFNSTVLATVIASFVLVIVTLLLYLFKRSIPFILATSNSLYATPGIVLALAAIFVINQTSIELTGIFFISILILKYLAMGTDSITVGIQKINKQYYYSSKTLGKDSQWYILNIQIPLINPSYLIAGILVWIDVIRELVIGLTLRPQCLDLLSIEIFKYMDLEILYMSGPWILAMVLITIIPIYWINIIIRRKEY